MCRWVAYTGKAERLENIVTRPARSLVHQSLHAVQCKTATNGDGFGIGWYGNREAPGLYRIHARLDAQVSGEEHGIDAFVGVVTSRKPALLRVRGGKPRPMWLLPIAPAER